MVRLMPVLGSAGVPGKSSSLPLSLYAGFCSAQGASGLGSIIREADNLPAFPPQSGFKLLTLSKASPPPHRGSTSFSYQGPRLPFAKRHKEAQWSRASTKAFSVWTAVCCSEPARLAWGVGQMLLFDRGPAAEGPGTKAAGRPSGWAGAVWWPLRPSSALSPQPCPAPGALHCTPNPALPCMPQPSLAPPAQPGTPSVPQLSASTSREPASPGCALGTCPRPPARVAGLASRLPPPGARALPPGAPVPPDPDAAWPPCASIKVHASTSRSALRQFLLCPSRSPDTALRADPGRVGSPGSNFGHRRVAVQSAVLKWPAPSVAARTRLTRAENGKRPRSAASEKPSRWASGGPACSAQQCSMEGLRIRLGTGGPVRSCLLGWALAVALMCALLRCLFFTVESIRWLFGAHSTMIGLSPSCTVELVPIFPHVCPSTLPPPAGKSWIDKRIPNCKVIFNNSFALDSTWVQPEEAILFHGYEKPHFLANQVALSLSRPAPASRPVPTVVFAPQPIPGGCLSSLKPAGGGPTIAIATAAAAAMVSVDPEGLRGLSPASVQPYHFVTLAPIRIPLRSAPLSDKSREGSRAPRPPALMLPTERKSGARPEEDQEPPSILVRREESLTVGSRPVASAPVPGSPWCVVWTGDDRVFFFNPTMQLSVWEKPLDLRNRGDLNRIIEDPPHKRKLETSTPDHSEGSSSEDGDEDQSVKAKRNRTEGHESSEPEEVAREDRATKTPPPQILLPLEERVTHFRDMLLERGVSAFSTWEKELHKIVFDPRYLLLNSEERKQIFEQFVKTRIREEYKEKKNKLLLAKEEFRKLLEESKVSPRTTFKEFAEKYGRDQRFRLVQKRKDQEHFFNQFIQILKKRDKENRLRLRKMR
ncbi:PREDICTED: transcription elongation regulator 1-like protein [Elephantulus edwardii]|uniref:transcription elongation regulator 1-like protein n=1 Tax=Elephantulus edwardii TaxID=28737 RepID=UPI0003F0C3F2|nr:PREDICTED: transcription elongation regulator 1-like protein [Elephantulus edwardii]